MAMAITGCVLVPGLIASVLVYATGKPFIDAERRCRACDYIFRGLTEPRCLECGRGDMFRAVGIPAVGAVSERLVVCPGVSFWLSGANMSRSKSHTEAI